MTGTVVTLEDLRVLIRSFNQTGQHFQQQRHYAPNHDEMGPWLAGDLTTSPSVSDPSYQVWFDLVSERVAAGRRIERLRVHAEPETQCQQWERWLGRWSTEAGEVIRYMTEADAAAIGVSRLVGVNDFWLFDSETLVEMPWPDGEWGEMTLVSDPVVVADARTCWELSWARAHEHR